MDLTEANDYDIQETVDLFEAALTAKVPELSLPPVRNILVAIDGSNQDDTTLGLATAVASRTKAKVSALFAYPGPHDAHKEAYLQDRLQAHDLVRPFENALEEKPSYAKILAAATAMRADLIVVDAPYLEDFEELGAASIGTNLDMLMNRATVPLLVTRAPKPDPRRCLEYLLMPITPPGPALATSASWALQLVAPNGMLRLLALVDREMLKSAGEVPGDADAHELDEALLAGLRTPESAGLVAALQREAAARNFRCRVSVRTGEVVPTMADLANEQEGLAVVPSARDAASSAYQRAQALIRASNNPVLVVQ